VGAADSLGVAEALGEAWSAAGFKPPAAEDTAATGSGLSAAVAVAVAASVAATRLAAVRAAAANTRLGRTITPTTSAEQSYGRATISCDMATESSAKRRRRVLPGWMWAIIGVLIIALVVALVTGTSDSKP